MSGGRTAGHLLEREVELAALRAAVAHAASGSGRLVVVQGPAGIGKTRLLAEVGKDAAAAGLTVASARGASLEQDHAFGGVRQLLTPLVAGREPAELFAGAAAAASPLFGGSAPAHEAPGTVLHGLYWLTVALSDHGPLALVLDDAHWLDGPSLRYVAYLANRLDALPVALLLAARRPEPGPQGELLARIVGEHDAVVLEPAALSPSGVTELVQALAAENAGADFCRAVGEVSQGNPLAVRELLRATDLSTPLPAHLEPSAAGTAGAVLLRRLGRLAPEVLAVAEAVAVLGPDADLQNVAALCGVSDEAAGEAADRLVVADVLVAERPLTFVHPLIRTAVYEQLLPHSRARLHALAARRLAEHAVPDARVAGHLLATEPAGDPWAVEVLTRAARAATSEGATDVAISLLRRALQEPPDGAARFGVLLDLGLAEVLVTDLGGVEHLAEVRTAVPDARSRIMLTIARGFLLVLAGRAREAISDFDALRPEVAGDPDLELELLAACVLVGSAGEETAPLVAERVLELRRRVGPADDRSPSVLGARAYAGAQAGEPIAEMADLAERSLQLLADDDPALLTWVHLPVVVLIMADRNPAAAAAIERGLAAARRVGGPSSLAVTLFCRARLALRSGDLADAQSDARAALETMRLHGLASVVPAPLSVLVEVRLECGDVDGAAALLGDGPADASRGFSMFDLFLLRARAQVHLAQGNHRQALQELRQGLERTALIGYRSPTFLPWHADLAVALAAAGDPAGAAAHAETAALLAEECGSDRARADALCARAAAGTDDVVTVLEQAVAGYARAGAVLQEARATLELAEARRRAGDTDGSVELLERVLQLSQRSGSSLLEHRAKAQLTSLGARMRRRPASGVDALTPSERRVAELAAAGLRNKEIAQELFLTVKTVESHLAKTFQKLGIASRTDVAPALRAAAAPSRVRA